MAKSLMCRDAGKYTHRAPHIDLFLHRSCSGTLYDVYDGNPMECDCTCHVGEVGHVPPETQSSAIHA
jgi:hypothetical protein